MITINNVGIKAIASVVPKRRIINTDLSDVYGEKETLKLISSIGVNERRVVDKNTSSSDLCYEAAKKLFIDSNFNESDIGAVIFVSQTPDYQLPATACILQDKLNISKKSMAFDINMGCSGYVYGLQVAASLVSCGVGNVLLLVGDTISRLVEPGDRSTELLFGDAGSATILGPSETDSIKSEMGTDGSGFESIIVRKRILKEAGSISTSTDSNLEMNGGEVFTFTLQRIPALVKDFLNNISLESNEIDACIYHQANHFMLKHLAKKCGIDLAKVPISLDLYGNTSCASIPVTLCSRPLNRYKSVLLVGFGVGLSWGVIHCDLTDALILPLSEYENE